MIRNRFSDQQIVSALIKYYTLSGPESAVVGKNYLLDALNRLPALIVRGQSGTLMSQLHELHPGLDLQASDTAVLSFIDDAITGLLAQTDLDYRIECLVRLLSSCLATNAIAEGPSALLADSTAAKLIDLLISECIGWSEDLGILGDQFIDRIENRILALAGQQVTIDECLQEFRRSTRQEHRHFRKLETVLANRASDDLAETKARLRSSLILNRAMAGRQLPLFMIFLLQGAWYEFLQHLSIHYGEDSGEWKGATRLTDALVRSLQPHRPGRKQLTLMAELPGHIIHFCKKLDFDTSSLERSLADVTHEYELIQAGTPSEPCEFQLLDHDDSGQGDTPLADEVVRELAALKPSDWFLYDDRDEPEEKMARLKVVVNSEDGMQLLFTNHNRRKAMPLSYARMAAFIASGTMKPLTPVSKTTGFIKTFLSNVLQNVSDQNRKKKRLEEARVRAAVNREYIESRKQSQESARIRHKRRSEHKRRRSRALRRKARQKYQVAVDAVSRLKPEAWVKLPLMTGTLTPAKLVAIIPGNDKYIFANRAGIKVAEYSSSQLSNMLVTENSEILDTGDEFEQVLSNVVIGLRENRNKSYSELTGETP